MSLNYRPQLPIRIVLIHSISNKCHEMYRNVSMKFLAIYWVIFCNRDDAPEIYDKQIAFLRRRED